MTKIEELQKQLEEAKKGKAKVDSEYVGYDDKAHLFDYKVDFNRFMDDLMHIVKS